MSINDILWGISNLLFFGFCLVFLGFTVFYIGFFRFWKTQPGLSVALDRIAFVLVLSLVFIGVFVDPQQPFWQAPDDVVWWRPWYRVFVYLAVCASSAYQLKVAIHRYLATEPLVIDVDPRTRPPIRKKRSGFD